MKMISKFFQLLTTAFLLLAGAGCAATANVKTPPADRSVICVDQSQRRILIMDAAKKWSDPQSILWSWKAEEDPGIAPQHSRWFSNPDECKPLPEKGLILMTASGGAAGILSIPERRLIFYGKAGVNPHSAELLPDGNLAAASSTANTLTIFSVPLRSQEPGTEEPPQAQYPFKDAHGCVWDKAQKLLWVVGGRELAGFEYNFNKYAPALRKKHSFKLENAPWLPEESFKKYPSAWRNYFGGHDLFPEPGTNSLFITGNFLVLKFDTRTHKFSLVNTNRAWKSISVNPADKRLIFQKPAKRWWSESISLQSGPPFTLPGARFYKGRWFSKNTFSY